MDAQDGLILDGLEEICGNEENCVEGLLRCILVGAYMRKSAAKSSYPACILIT
jgi:hypothetical protein